MAYIGNQTGGDADARTAEAERIINIIHDAGYDSSAVGELCGEKAGKFWHETKQRLMQYGGKAQISGPQLFWLRDIKAKILEEA